MRWSVASGQWPVVAVCSEWELAGSENGGCFGRLSALGAPFCYLCVNSFALVQKKDFTQRSLRSAETTERHHNARISSARFLKLMRIVPVSNQPERNHG